MLLYKSVIAHGEKTYVKRVREILCGLCAETRFDQKMFRLVSAYKHTNPYITVGYYYYLLLYIFFMLTHINLLFNYHELSNIVSALFFFSFCLFV